MIGVVDLVRMHSLDDGVGSFDRVDLLVLP